MVRALGFSERSVLGRSPRDPHSTHPRPHRPGVHPLADPSRLSSRRVGLRPGPGFGASRSSRSSRWTSPPSWASPCSSPCSRRPRPRGRRSAGADRPAGALMSGRSGWVRVPPDLAAPGPGGPAQPPPGVRCSGWWSSFVLAAVTASWITPFPEDAANATDPAATLLSPRSTHWFGTDLVGRDVFTRVMFAARTSLGITAFVLVTAAVVGLAVGLTAGFFGGLVDTVLMRITPCSSRSPHCCCRSPSPPPSPRVR